MKGKREVRMRERKVLVSPKWRYLLLLRCQVRGSNKRVQLKQQDYYQRWRKRNKCWEKSGEKQGTALEKEGENPKNESGGEEGRNMEGLQMELKLWEKGKETDLGEKKKIKSGKLKWKKTGMGEEGQ